MKTKMLYFGLAFCLFYGLTEAQTSFGGFTDTDPANNAGTGGGASGSYFGYQAGLNTTGFSNTAIGYRSLYTNTGGIRNTAIGYQSLYFNTGNSNTANGNRALYNNTTGDYNTATGGWTLYSNSTGNQNTAYGYQSLYSNTASGNTAVGYQSLYSNTSGIYNSAHGYQTLHNNTGSFNAADGYQSLYNNTTGTYNTANGVWASYSNTSGHNNTASGAYALTFNTIGYNNTAIGAYALNANTTGDQNTAIGRGAGPNANNRTNTTALGYNTTTTASNQVRLGNASVTSIGGYANWSNLSDGRFKKEIREDIPGLDFITKLRPVSYDLDRAGIGAFLGREDDEHTEAQSYERNVGFIAQEVEQLLIENDYAPIGVEAPDNEKDHYSMRYAEFVVPLTKAVQELNALVTSQQQLIETQQERIEAMESLVAGEAKGNSDGIIQSKEDEIPKEGFALYQNTPNPFNSTTTISAAVPEHVQEAKIVIYNLQGMELESYSIYERGNVNISIRGGHLPSGMYLYALLADERLIDTKKMILTK